MSVRADHQDPRAKRRVFLVDDHPAVQEGLAAVFNQQRDLEICGSAASAREALQSIARLKPDIAIIDLTLQDGSGLELIKDLHARDPRLPLLALSMHDEMLYAERTLQAGASGYILKRAAPERILQAVREVHAGGVPMSSEIARKVLGTFREPAPAATEEQTLSRREQEVLELLAQGCSNKEIADKLSISIETVTWHLKHIYGKLHVRSRTQAALRFLSLRKGQQ